MRLKGESPFRAHGQSSRHTPKHLPNPRTAGRGVTQSRGRITYHYRGGRTVTKRRRYASSGGVNPRSVPGAKRRPTNPALRDPLGLLHLMGVAGKPSRPSGEGINTYGFGTTDPLGRLSNDFKYRQQVARALRAVRGSGMKAAASQSAVKQADLLWHLVHEAYGGKQPGLSVGTGRGNLGEVRGDARNTARLAEDVVYGVAGVNPRSRAALQKILLHEWTHTRQPWQGASKAKTEGGAEAYARQVAKHYGLGNKPATYDSYVKYVRKYLGRDWITKGQFK